MPAQTPPGASTPALANLEAVLGEDESARIAPVRALAKNAAPDVTQRLLEEFVGAQTTAYRQALLTALGAIKREGVVGVLTLVAEADLSPPMERRLAANGLAKQGPDAMRQLGVMARTSSNSSVRTYAMMALSQSKTDLGWQMLAEAVRDGDGVMRTTGIRYLQAAPASDLVTEARLAVAEDASSIGAATAVRQLAEAGHPRAAELVQEICQRSGTDRGSTAVDLLYAVHLVLTPDLFGPALRLASAMPGAGVLGKRALDEVLPKLTANQDFLAFVQRSLREAKDPSQIRTSLKLLTKVPGAEVSEQIVGFTASTDVGVVSTALRVLADRGDDRVVRDVERLLKSKDEGLRLQALQCVHALRESDSAWHDDLLARMRKASKSRRNAAEFGLTMTLLAELGSEEALKSVWKALSHKQWTVRAAAIDYCRVVRSVDSVPELIDRLDREEGRLREDLLDTLRSLTAMRFNSQGQWRRWWKESKEGFELIPADAFAKEKQAKRKPQGRTATSYYGIPLVSNRVVFVVDISGSMSAKIGTGGNRTRLDEAKRQLRRVIENSPKEFLFNVVSFHTTIDAIFDRMIPMVGRNRKQASELVDELKPTGATNVHDALQRAFEETELDTIYLLSDGAPSAGPITDPNELADTVKRWNVTRRLRIHCISIGSDSAMLKRIAEESGGSYATSR